MCVGSMVGVCGINGGCVVEINLHTDTLEYIADIVFTITIIFQLTIFSIYCSFLLCGHFAPAALDCVQALNI